MSFETFWSVYPRKISKGYARKVWDKLKPDAAMEEKMMSALEYQKSWRSKAEKYNKDLPRDKRIFIPFWKNVGTWINQQCWDDEYESIPEKPKPQKTMCATCRQEEGKYPVAGVLYCIKCYDKCPKNYVPKLRVVR